MEGPIRHVQYQLAPCLTNSRKTGNVNQASDSFCGRDMSAKACAMHNVTQAYWVSKISRPLAAWMGRAFPGYNLANAAT
jgi:hypothetical protein